ncbi:MAG: dipeptide epimerase [Gemmataceae bacterium]
MAQIVELTAHHVCIRLRRAIKHASHRREETDNLIVRCRLDDGSVGHGEGVPRDYVTGETIDSALQLLDRSRLREQLGQVGSFETAVSQAEALRLAPIVGDTRGIGGNAARCAVELAWLDACGRRFGKPLSSLTSMLAPECHAPSEVVRYSGAITSATGLKLRVSAWAQRLYGLRQIKVKVGITGQDDVSRLKVIRRCAGAAMDLRVDANEAWKPDEVVARIRELERFGITSVEQPVSHEQVACLAQVRREVQTPIMLDESLCGLVDGQRAIAEGLCDLFNLRLSKCGGFIPSLRLAQLARKHGLRCQLGCQVGETAILSAAGRHFAASVGQLRYVEGSYDRRLVREALGRVDLTFGVGGKAPALPGPGLGVEIDPDALARVTVRTVRLT